MEGRFNVDERGSKIIASRMALLEEGKPPALSAQARNTRRGNGSNYAGYSGNDNYSESAYYSENTDAAAYSFANENPETYDAVVQQNPMHTAANVADALSKQDEQGHIKVPVSAIIELVITPERESEIVTRALTAILQKHHGSTMVFLKLMGSRRRIRLDPRYYVNGQDMALQDELKELLGDNAFRVKEI